MSRDCSQCGNNGYKSRTCGTEAPGGCGSGGGENGIMLFGVRVNTVQQDQINNSFRKSLSMNNLSQYNEQPQDSDADAGYASDDVVHASGKSRERKRGVPWTEEEHKLFLLGLQKVGKGDWRGISRNFVKTRTPTQVASHAQKYFLRRNNQNRLRRRSSLFDITTDTVMNPLNEEDNDHLHHEVTPTPHQQGFPVSTFSATTSQMIVPATKFNSMENLTLGVPSSSISSSSIFKIKPSSSTKPLRLVPILPSAKMADLNLNHKIRTNIREPNLPLSLKLSTPTSDDQSSPSTSSSSHSSSAFQAMSGGDSIISVA